MGTPLRPTGMRVRLSQAFRDFVAAQRPLPFETSEEYEETSWPRQLREFGDAEGIVEGPVFPGTDAPEVDVRWVTGSFAGLRYGYLPEWLEEVSKPV